MRPSASPTVRRAALLSAAALLLAAVGPQAVAETDPDKALRKDLDRIFAETAPAKAVLAARVLDLGTDGKAAPRVLYSVRSKRPMIPASNMKLFSTAAAWDRLGPAWKIRTLVGHLPRGEGKPPDLAVLGGGDPNFSGRFFGGDEVGALRKWAAGLQARGVTHVGRVLLDDHLFERVLVHPHWPQNQLHKWYEAPVAALNLNDNCVDVHLAPTSPGEAARVWVEPKTRYVVLTNRVKTTAKRGAHRYGVEREALGGAIPGIRIVATGAVWAKAGATVVHRTVTDPTLYFGTVLAETLRAEGIKVDGPLVRARLVGRGGLVKGFVKDIVHASRIDLTATVANRRSQGVYAECLMKLTGAFAHRPDARYWNAKPSERPALASWENGRRAIRRWCDDRGIGAEGCVFDDGSGLSKSNRLTAAAISELLAVMARRHGEGYMMTLARPGVGSLAKRMRDTPAVGRVWAKTGYVRGVSALSGYVRTRSGRLVAFAILVNDMPRGQLWKARLAQDKACLRMVEYAGTTAATGKQAG